MGCFNMIGCVSKLPILVNDDCVGFICYRECPPSGKHGEDWAPSLFLVPMFPAFFGKYDEYGRLEDVNTNDTYLKKLLEKLDLDIVSLQDGLTDHNDEAEKRIKEVFGLDKNAELALCIEHRSVYDYLVKQLYDNMVDRWDKSPRSNDFFVKDKSFDPTTPCSYLYQDCNKKWAFYYKIFHDEFWKEYTKKPYCELTAFWFALTRFSIPFTESVYCSQNAAIDEHLDLYRLYVKILEQQQKELSDDGY